MSQPHDPHQEPHEHHTADPAALEDPVHGDVAHHELEVEAEDGDEESATADDPLAEDADPEAYAADWAGVAEPAESTGDPRVDDAVRRLAAVRRVPPGEHVAVYEDVHRGLQDALADLDGS